MELKILGLLLFLGINSIYGETFPYNIGVGIADTTGPPVGVIFMAYGKLDQVGSGIHLRTFARSFIIENNGQRFVFVSVESAMISHNVRAKVINNLQSKFGDIYSNKNVMISATHTHCSPGGSNNYALFDISTLGFVQNTFDALVSGITKSIEEAHENMVPGRIFIDHGQVLNANINRSPSAYQQNPDKEKKAYNYDVDKTMTQVKFIESVTGRPIGVINWFAVHSTSMNNTNTLVSSDNLGYASLLFEKKMNQENKGEKSPGKHKFVASFSVTNAGDASPNTKGPKCEYSGKACDIIKGCENEESCIASGPGKNMFESTSIIAHMLFNESMNIWEKSTAKEIKGPVNVVHQFVNMTEQIVDYFDSTINKMVKVRGCKAAIGKTFTLGTTDGPGIDWFKDTSSEQDFFSWQNFVDWFSKTPEETLKRIVESTMNTSPDDEKCHGVKKIVVSQKTSKNIVLSKALEMLPDVVSTQVAIIGDLIIAGVPGEFTTMAGRRMKKLLSNITNHKNWNVVIAGLCNTYSDYVTTPEEYELQRYEGSSTIFGPHTLTIYLEQYRKLALAAIEMKNLTDGKPPNILENLNLPFIPAEEKREVWDPTVTPFGYCLKQPKKFVFPGQTVTATFSAGNPCNSLMNISTYLTVERKIEQQINDTTGRITSQWKIIADDSDWETKFEWSIKSGIAKITYDIPQNIKPGKYRIGHAGHYNNNNGIFAYSNYTKTFEIKPKDFHVCKQYPLRNSSIHLVFITIK